MLRTPYYVSVALTLLAMLGSTFADEASKTSNATNSAIAVSEDVVPKRIEKPTTDWLKEKPIATTARRTKKAAATKTAATQKSSRRSAAQRMSSARRSKIYDLKSPAPSKPTSAPATTKTAPAIGRTTTNTLGVPAASPSTIPNTRQAPITHGGLESANVGNNQPVPRQTRVAPSTSGVNGVEAPIVVESPSDFVADPIVDERLDTGSANRGDGTSPNNGAAESELESTLIDATGDVERIVVEAGNDPIDTPYVADRSASNVRSVLSNSAIRHQFEDNASQAQITQEQLFSDNVDSNSIEEIPDAPLSATPIGDIGDDIGTPVEQNLDSESDQDEDDSDLLVENASPVLAVKTRGPRTIKVGKAATYVIEATNASDVDARDVVLRINIPTWTELTRQDPTVGAARIQPDDRGNTVMEWSVGHLQARAVERLVLKVVPRSSRPFDLGVTWAFNPVRTETQIQVQEPKLLMSVRGPQDVLFGETKVYTITISNPGTGDAENVTLQLLPLIPSDNASAIRQLGDLRAGTRRTVEVEMTARQTGRLQIRAETTADGGLTARGHQDVLVRRAKMEVAVKGPKMKYAGTKGSYTITVTNTGDAVAREVVAVATLPAGAKSITNRSNGIVHNSHSQVHWELGSMRPGATRRLDVQCLLTKAGNNRVDVRALASGNLNAAKSVITAVESLADLKLVVDDPKGAIATGTDVAYEVRIVNRGTKEARNIEVVGYFSEGIEPQRIEGWAGKVTEGQVELDAIKRLGPGQEMIVKITAQAQRSGNHVFRAELACNSPETRLASEEWTRFYGDQPEKVGKEARIQAKKTTAIRTQTKAR